MSATTIPQTTTPSPKRSFRRRYSVAHGTANQVLGMLAGSGMLVAATQVDGGSMATNLMIGGFISVYLNCHALAHYIAGRLVGLRFRGYGVRGTDHPEGYPPGIRQLMLRMPFYVALSTKESRKQASPHAKAIYYAAGETSTAVCSIAYAAIATTANIPGGQFFLVAMIVFNAISTVVTTRTPSGDYGKALRALRG